MISSRVRDCLGTGCTAKLAVYVAKVKLYSALRDLKTARDVRPPHALRCSREASWTSRRLKGACPYVSVGDAFR